MFQQIENARLLHEAPPGSTVHRDPAGAGWLVIGYTHAPYLVDGEGNVTECTPLVGIVDASAVPNEDAATNPDAPP